MLYERHAGGLLSFCTYMLGSRHDAEDAVQATFASAYRALRANERPVVLRPWLFAIARNDCLSIMRKRRPTVELNGELALRGDPLRELELHKEVRQMLEGLRELPEPQRAALVLAELHGLSQAEMGTVLDVQPEQVKAYVYQARSNLISEKRAREADCREIREELASARGAALLRGRLRRHVRSCADCRVYADGVARQRRHLGALLPLAPSLLLKYRALKDALGLGGADPATYAGSATVAGSVAGAAAEIAGGGIKAIAVKVAAGAAILGATAGVGASVLSAPATPPESARTSTTAGSAKPSLLASAGGANAVSWSSSARARRPRLSGESLQEGAQGASPSSRTRLGSRAVGGGGGGGADTGGGRELGGSAREGQRGQSEGHAPQNGQSPRESPEEHQKQSEQHARQNQEREQESREDQQESKGRQLANEERHQQKTEERERKSQRRKQEREERERVGQSRPPRTEEERQKKREEREQHRKEREAAK